jgi:methylated-DNA-[protein]-cysteine S-methyltransferase
VAAAEYLASPVGPLTIITRPDALVAIRFGTTPAAAPDSSASAFHRDVMARLRAYFDGDRRAIDAIVVAPPGTPFQQAVWLALRDILPGTTVTYRALAGRIGRPAAIRAVGAANGANPIPIVLPCHRVVGSNGSLVGYGGGLESKRWLLVHEGAAPPLVSSPAPIAHRYSNRMT